MQVCGSVDGDCLWTLVQLARGDRESAQERTQGIWSFLAHGPGSVLPRSFGTEAVCPMRVCRVCVSPCGVRWCGEGWWPQQGAQNCDGAAYRTLEVPPASSQVLSVSLWTVPTQCEHQNAGNVLQLLLASYNGILCSIHPESMCVC